MVGPAWKPLKKFAVALYFYTAGSKHELSLNIGDQLQVEEETEGWYKGCLIKSATSAPNKKGIFPRSYVKVLDSLAGCLLDTDVVLSQIHQALSEWGNMLRTCFTEGKMTQFHSVKERVSLLLEVRRQIINPGTSHEVREALKGKALDKVEEVRTLMGQDITPRNAKGEIADEGNSGVVALYHLHQQQEEVAKKHSKVPALRVIKTEDKNKKDADKKNKKKARREDMRKSVLFARSQLIGTSEAENEAAQQPPEQVPYHILFDMRVLICPMTDPAELYFSLYNGVKNEFVTEEYLVLMTDKGMPQDLSKLGKLKTVFADLPMREWQAGELYLVMRIIKRTKAPGADDTKKPIRRPFGVALLALGSKGSEPVLALNKELEHTFPVFSPTTESSFASLHELILKNNFQATKSGPLIEVPNSKGVCVALTLQQGDINGLIVEGRCLTNRKTLLDSPTLNYLRNDLYFTLHSGEFVRDKIGSNKNVMAMFSVHLTNGDVVPDCIYKGSGTTPVSETDSLVFSHSNSPAWDELFSLRFPSPITLDWYQDKWLFVQLFHIGDKGKDKEEFSHAFMKLYKDDGPVIEDGIHTLACYKPTPTPFPPNLSQKNEDAKLGGVKKGEHVKIKIQLSSTELTSSSYIYALLRWKLSSAGLEDVLKRFVFIEAAEIVKFMGDVINTIFEIMEAREDLSLLSFDALVFIFSLGARVSASLDKYLNSQFQAPLVHRNLLSCLKYYLTQTGETSHSKMLSTFKSLAYIFKFIIASRALYVKQSTATGKDKIPKIQNDTFTKDMLEIFDLFTELMKNSSPQMRGPQSSALKNISSIFGDLQAVFSKVELSRIISRFIQSVQYSPQLELFNKEKLILINKLVCSSPLFLDNESLEILLPPVLYQIGLHLNGTHHDEILQSILILSVISNTFQTKVKTEESIFKVLEHIPGVMNAVRTLREDSEFADQPVMCLLAIIKMSSRGVIERYLTSLGGWDVQAEFLTELFTLLIEILSGNRTPTASRQQPPLTPSSALSPTSPTPSLGSTPPLSSTPPISSTPPGLSSTPPTSMHSRPSTPAASPTTANGAQPKSGTPKKPLVLSLSSAPVTTTPFPSHWLFINMFAYGTILKMTDYVNEYIVKQYKQGLSSLTKKLWERVLALILVFLRAKTLAVEYYPPLKRNFVLERYNDMRKPMAQILLRIWSALKPADQMGFLAHLIGPTIHLMMMEPFFIQDTGVKLYSGLMELEVKETKTIKQVEALTIDALDACAYEGILPKNFNTFFVSKMQAAFAASKTPLLAQTGKKFIADITCLLDLLADLSDLPIAPVYEDERVEAIIKLMAYLKQTGRISSYLKYVHMLESIHATSGNFGEAGHTILLHAEVMKWDDDVVDPVGIFPKEPQRTRKERLYKAALDYFDKGKLWEEGIKLIKELRIQYEFTLYDYQKLAEILDTQATLVRKITSIERFFPEYFRVGFYGKGFDAKHQGKEYVFRGLELEDRPEFVTRMQARFPDANFLNYTEPPPEDILNSPQQHIQVFIVRPALEDGAVNPDMPQSILKYHQLNNRKVFFYAKPFRKTKTGNEFKDLWIRNYMYHTSNKLPGIHRRVEIVKTDQEELSPLKNAVNNIEAKNVEIAQFARKFEMGHEDGKNLNPFTMVMKGAIDAAVNGGVDMYIDMFINPVYIKEWPGDSVLVRQLITIIRTHAALLERGLNIHRRFCGPSLAPLQELMEQKFVTTKTNAENLAMPS